LRSRKGYDKIRIAIRSSRPMATPLYKHLE
jgi:hypothetical protein